jgi:hypothetical protein
MPRGETALAVYEGQLEEVDIERCVREFVNAGYPRARCADLRKQRDYLGGHQRSPALLESCPVPQVVKV